MNCGLRTIHEPPYQREKEGEPRPPEGLAGGKGVLLICQAQLALLNDHQRFTASGVRQVGIDRVDIIGTQNILAEYVQGWPFHTCASERLPGT